MTIVACVFKRGGDYTAAHVERLRSMVPDDLPVVCLTDWDEGIEGVASIPLKHGWPGWWSKVELFRPGVLDCSTIYVDLDVTIHADFKALRSERFTMCRDFMRPDLLNSSVMAWRKPPTQVYTRFCGAPEAIMHKFRRWPQIGDQAFIQSVVGDCDTFPRGLVVSYRKQARNGPPPGAAVVAYHGRPKPWDV